MVRATGLFVISNSLVKEIQTMNFIEQLDPELRAVVEKLPTDRPLDLNEIPVARVKMKKMVTAMLSNLPAVEGVTSQDQFAPGLQGDPAVRVRVYRPDDQ